MHNGCAPAAEVFIRQMKLQHVGMFLQELMDRFAQLPDAFTVNDPHAQDSPRLALRQIIQYERFHLTRLERVQVQHAINRQLQRLVVHAAI